MTHSKKPYTSASSKDCPEVPTAKPATVVSSNLPPVIKPKEVPAESNYNVSWKPLPNARNYVVTRDGIVVKTTNDGSVVSFRDASGNDSSKYEVSYIDENGNKQVIESTTTKIKAKVARLKPTDKGYVLSKGLASVTVIKDRGEYYVCVNANGKHVYEGPDSLEGIIKLVAAKLTYFAELASLPPIVAQQPANVYSATDETQVNRLIGMAKRAGEYYAEVPFGTYKTKVAPQVLPAGTVVKTTEDKAAVVK